MRQVLFMASVLVIILGGCDTGDPYYLEDQAVGVDSVWRDSTSTTDIKSRTDLNMADTGSTTNEMRLYKSGTRIKAKVMRTADGLQALMGWYDTELETDCIFTVAEDGKTRCIPWKLIIGLSTSVDLFSDSDCTNGIFLTGYKRGCWPNGLDFVSFQIVTTTECATTANYQIYRNPIVHNGGSSGIKVYKKSDGSCSDVSDSYSEYLLLDSLGEKVGPNTFVEATTAIVD